jgi:hypothetical protein
MKQITLKELVQRSPLRPACPDVVSCAALTTATRFLEATLHEIVNRTA